MISEIQELISRRKHSMAAYTEAQIDDMFTYHDDPAKVPHYQAVNAAAKAFFKVVQDNAPDSADRSAAFRHIRSARMDANAAIALDGKF